MVEIIGFIISLLALLYLFVKQNFPTQRPAESPRYQNEEFEEDDPFKDFMKAVEKEAASREALQHLPPPPSKAIKKQKKAKPPSLAEYQLISQIETRQIKSSLEDRHLTSTFSHRENLPGRSLALSVSHRRIEEEKENRSSRVRLAMSRLVNRRDMMIYQEIVGKPKSLRSE